MKLKYIFGPVLSRRLGRSLGIDIIPYKTCSFDCIYCECGKTTNLTDKRKIYVPTDEVISEIEKYLSTEPKLDYITFAGSGEPTLHSELGVIINYIKNNYPQYKVALISNSYFLNKEIIEDIVNVDLIIPSLDAATEKSYQKINRPTSKSSINEIINGLVYLNKKFNGNMWLEIFIVPGINDSDKEIEAFRNIIKKINPDKVQLNSLDRKGTEEWVEKVKREELNIISNKLSDRKNISADIEIIV